MEIEIVFMKKIIMRKTLTEASTIPFGEGIAKGLNG